MLKILLFSAFLIIKSARNSCRKYYFNKLIDYPVGQTSKTFPFSDNFSLIYSSFRLGFQSQKPIKKKSENYLFLNEKMAKN